MAVQERKMKIFLNFIILCSIITCVVAQDNNITEKAIKKAMEQEKKFAKEQRFYQGDEYNLKDSEIDPKSLSKIKAIEPEYDFDMDTGVYDD